MGRVIALRAMGRSVFGTKMWNDATKRKNYYFISICRFEFLLYKNLIHDDMLVETIERPTRH